MSKHNNRNIVSSFSKATGLPLDMLGANPMFHLYSDNELVIEGAKNLEYYSETDVRISFGNKLISITGRNLCIKCLANGSLSVTGILECITLSHTEN